ncbi:MAG TPA: hypothetical protein DEP42_00210, partial [Ruminococcaceae bacterium]|nr:hypothetical protein [Oscillospiraceae bacterium]
MKVKPSKWFYLLGIALLVAGLIISVIFAINSTLTAMRTGERVQLPGQSTLHLKKKGVYDIVYTVANTGKSVGDASPYKNLNYTLTAADGQTVSVTGQGQPVPVFTVKQTGTYTLRAVYPEGKGAQVTAVILPMTNTQSTG